MGRWRATSFWLETAGDDLAPRPSLDGSTDADVAILGAGFSGLWTAYYLLRSDPSLRVVIVEAETAGFGASGRNGSWCAPDLNISASSLARRHGHDAARRIVQATYDAIDEIERACAEEQLACGFQRGGELVVARGPQGLPALEATLRENELFGFGERWHRLDAAEVAARIRVAGAIGGVYSPFAAVVHPGRLVRGLARLVERLGGRIVERTPVTNVRRAEDGRPAALITSLGEVRAPVVVLAGEAYLTRLPGLRRQLVPIYSLIALTEPLSDRQWQEIGWENRECVASTRLSVDYLARTEDGRILFGGRGAPYRFGSPIRDEYDRHGPTHEMLRGFVRAWFPSIADVRFTHAWGGPLGMPRDWHPTIALDRSTGVATARGYLGHGVAMANLAGRTLAELIRDERTERTELPLVGHRSRDWEPEPFRWLGVRYTQWALGRLDRNVEVTGRPPSGRSLAEWLARH
jgi:glycine/D-amino acid oxidase-like deaminating enzyme